MADSPSQQAPRELNHIRLTLLVSILITILTAVIFATPQIVFVAALLCAAPLVGLVMGWLLNRGLTVTRSLPEAGTVGDVVSGRLTVCNRLNLPNFFIHLDAGQVPPPGYDEGAAPASTNAIWPVVAIGSPEHTVPVLRSKGCIHWEPHWRLQRRGVYRLPPARGAAGDPLGLSRLLKPRTGTDTITVLPQPVKIDRLGFLGGVEAGLHSPQHATVVAEAMDFHGVRTWHPGESIRRVHWKSTARTGNLHVVEWEENLASDLTLLFDTPTLSAASAGTGDPCDDLLEVAVTLAASIAVYLLENGFHFQMFSWQGACDVQSPGSSPSGSAVTTGTIAASTHEVPVSGVTAPGRGNRRSGDVDSPRLCRHEAHNVSSINATLKMLAQIERLPQASSSGQRARQAQPLTLSDLARYAAPHIHRGASVLIVTATTADVTGALQIVEAQAPRGTCAYALALDTESFETALNAVSAASANDDTPAAVFPTAFSPTTAVRVVRHGDSLTAALEFS